MLDNHRPSPPVDTPLAARTAPLSSGAALPPLAFPHSPERHHSPPFAVHGLRRIAYILSGLFFVGLAILGAMLPLLPTTPFLLLASFFFVRSSPPLNRWLLRSRLFGPFLRDWQQHRAVRPGVKAVALTMLPIAVVASAYFGNLRWHLVLLLLALASIGAYVVLRLPVLREAPAESSLTQP